jgi:hypothetical protein
MGFVTPYVLSSLLIFGDGARTAFDVFENHVLSACAKYGNTSGSLRYAFAYSG